MKQSVLEVAAPTGKVLEALKGGLGGSFEVLEIQDLSMKVVLATPRRGWSWGTRLDVSVLRLKKGTRIIIDAKRRVAWNATPDLEQALARFLASVQERFPAPSLDTSA